MDSLSSLRGFGGGAVKIGFSNGVGRSAGGVLKKLSRMFLSMAGGALGIGGALGARGIVCGAAGNCSPV